MLEPCIPVCHSSFCARCGSGEVQVPVDGEMQPVPWQDQVRYGGSSGGCEPDATTMAAEWALFCDRKSLIGVLGVMHYVGVLFGAIAGAALSERKGRRAVCAYSELATGVLTAACCLCGDYDDVWSFPYLYLQFVLGFLGSVANVAGFTLAAELCGSKNRTRYSINLFSYGWATTCVITPMLGYVLSNHLTGRGNWRNLQLAGGLIITAHGLACIRWLPESPRWLLSQAQAEARVAQHASVGDGGAAKMQQFDEILTDLMGGRELEQLVLAAHANDVAAEEPEAAVSSAEEESGEAGLKPLLQGPTLVVSLGICYLWFSASMSYYGISYVSTHAVILGPIKRRMSF